MTQEEYQREQEELQRLINEYNNLVNRRNRLAEQYNMLVQELEYSLNATIQSINYAASVQKIVVPKLEISAKAVTEVSGLVDGVKAEIEDLSAKYFIMKNISTATKKLTGLNNEYQRNFGMYALLRRVALGYVVGIDKHIISNETLRLTVEKNYLQNADYWISHCLMATMLWVTDEPEAAARAVSKAMNIDPHKSSLYFLLINLHFGRSDAAAKWFEYYIKDIDVKNIGDEIRILLQAYLYNICGDDPSFKRKMQNAFDTLLATVKSTTANYDNTMRSKALEFISAHVHKTSEEFAELVRSCKDYPQLISALEGAEKNAVFAKYFQDMLDDDCSAPKNMIERIQNVLYDLINTYDEAELHIIRDMDYNEMILKARGDIDAAKRMYDTKYRPDKPQTLADLMVKLAFPSTGDDVDIRVRKFAVSFLCENIISAFNLFKQQYTKLAKETHEVTIDTFTVTVNEKAPHEAKQALTELYKKNRKRFIRSDKKVKVLTVVTVIFWALWVLTTAITGIVFANTGNFPVWGIVLFVITFLGSVGFTIWLIFQRRKAGEALLARMERALKTLDGIIDALANWRSKFNIADEQSAALLEILSKFSSKNKEEVAQ